MSHRGDAAGARVFSSILPQMVGGAETSRLGGEISRRKWRIVLRQNYYTFGVWFFLDSIGLKNLAPVILRIWSGWKTNRSSFRSGWLQISSLVTGSSLPLTNSQGGYCNSFQPEFYFSDIFGGIQVPYLPHHHQPVVWSLCNLPRCMIEPRIWVGQPFPGCLDSLSPLGWVMTFVNDIFRLSKNPDLNLHSPRESGKGTTQQIHMPRIHSRCQSYLRKPASRTPKQVKVKPLVEHEIFIWNKSNKHSSHGRGHVPHLTASHPRQNRHPTHLTLHKIINDSLVQKAANGRETDSGPLFASKRCLLEGVRGAWVFEGISGDLNWDLSKY